MRNETARILRENRPSGRSPKAHFPAPIVAAATYRQEGVVGGRVLGNVDGCIVEADRRAKGDAKDGTENPKELKHLARVVKAISSGPAMAAQRGRRPQTRGGGERRRGGGNDDGGADDGGGRNSPRLVRFRHRTSSPANSPFASPRVSQASPLAGRFHEQYVRQQKVNEHAAAMERLSISSPLGGARRAAQLAASPSAIATSPHGASPLAMRRGMRGPAKLSSDHLKQHQAALAGNESPAAADLRPATTATGTSAQAVGRYDDALTFSSSSSPLTGRRRVHYATSTNASQSPMPSPRSGRALRPAQAPVSGKLPARSPTAPSPGPRPKSTAGSDWLGQGALRSASVPPRGDRLHTDGEADDDGSSSSSLSSDSEPLFRCKTAAERITQPRPGWDRPWKKSRTKGIYPQVKELTTVFDGLADDFGATDERLAGIIGLLKERITEHEQEDDF